MVLTGILVCSKALLVMMKKTRGEKRIGIVEDNYNVRNNITRHVHEGWSFHRVWGPNKILNGLLKRARRGSQYLANTHQEPAWPKVDLCHLWRMVSSGRTPWVVSTSVGLPFGWPRRWYEHGLSLLASDRCRRIIVNSRSALERQRYKAEMYPAYMDAVTRKTEILYPPQEPCIESWEEKGCVEDALTLAFVGHLFFQKGGAEIVRVLSDMVSHGADIRLVVVSNLKDAYRMGEIDGRVEERARIADKLKNERWIEWYRRLPHAEVMRVFRRAHIGLLPSYAEAFGYSVVEAQANGCATITTDVFALPEINHSKVGWLIPVAEGESVPRRAPEDASGRIEAGLRNALEEAMQNRDLVRAKGEAAIERIKREHCPDRHADRLRMIYEMALDGPILEQ